MIPQQAKEGTRTDVDQLAINTIRTLAIDGVQKANSGHPGTPLEQLPPPMRCGKRSSATIHSNRGGLTATALFSPRATLRCCSMRLIHLAGIKAENASYTEKDRLAVTLDDIKTFRQAGSRCPGHPETAGRRGWKPQPVRSGRVFPTASEWRLPANGWRLTTTARAPICSTSIHMRFVAMAA